MGKKKTKKLWEGYNEYTYIDGDGKFVKFIARDDSDANLYRIRCRNIENRKKVVGVVVWGQLYQIQKMIWERFMTL